MFVGTQIVGIHDVITQSCGYSYKIMGLQNCGYAK